MSATYAPTAAPPSSLRVWCDSRYIYAELPTKPSAPACVMSFPRDGAGFQRLLGTLYGHADNSGLMPENFKPGRKLVGSAMQHDMAQAVLRRRGIIR
jgi:hypothetical protein